MREKDLGVKWFNTIFYPKRKTARAARYEDGVLPRLRTQRVNLFTPWGPRYSWEKRGTTIQIGDKEVEVLYFLANILEEWIANMPGKKFSWMFLGADLYGTRINQLPQWTVDDYFCSLRGWLKLILPNANFRLWSEFNQAAEGYRQKVRANFEEYVDSGLLQRTTQTAKVMGSNDPQEYLIERFAEAMLIEKRLRPIKISCVARYKDDKVDWKLPRLYFLPEYLQAPWL